MSIVLQYGFPKTRYGYDDLEYALRFYFGRVLLPRLCLQSKWCTSAGLTIRIDATGAVLISCLFVGLQGPKEGKYLPRIAFLYKCQAKKGWNGRPIGAFVH